MFTIKTVFPVSEDMEESKFISNKRTELLSDVDVAEAVDLYRSYIRAGYDVAVNFTAPEGGDEEDADPFVMADELTKQGIDYKASLKINTKGSYNDMLPAMHLVEAAGFDMTVAVKLKIAESTTLNTDDPATWTDEDAVFKITPKASSNSVMDLKSLYENLTNKGYDVQIALSPKADKDADEGEEFAKQCSVYPAGTEIKFTLKQAEEE